VTMPIFCTGRVYPNAPSGSKVGCLGRPHPHFLRVLWNQGVRPWTAARNGVWTIFDHTGPDPQFGLNPTIRWLWTPAPLRKAEIRWLWHSDVNEWQWRLVIREDSFSGTWATNYSSALFPGINWNPEQEVLLFKDFFQPFNPTVADPQISLRPARYKDLPANTCMV